MFLPDPMDAFGAIAKGSRYADEGVSAATKYADEAVEGAQSIALRADSDPLRKHLGAAYGSEQFGDEVDQIVDHIGREGGTINILSGADRTRMTYSPGNLGVAGKLDIVDDASIGAWRHEYQHFLDDLGQGYPGYSHYYRDPELMWSFERNAYMREIETAREFGIDTAIPQIETLMDARKRELLPPEYWPDYYD